MPLVESKDFKALINNKPFLSVKKKQTRNIWKTQWNVKKWRLGNLLDFSNQHNYYYKLVGTDLSRQTSTNISQ